MRFQADSYTENFTSMNIFGQKDIYMYRVLDWKGLKVIYYC